MVNSLQELAELSVAAIEGSANRSRREELDMIEDKEALNRYHCEKRQIR